MIWKLVVIALLVGIVDYCQGKATIKDNGYEDFVIAISPEIPQDDSMLQQIQSMMNDMSRYLYTATRNRAYLRTVKILLPKTWKYAHNGTLTGETFQDAEFRIDTANSAYGDSPYTKQLAECGVPGYYTHLTPAYVMDGALYGDKGKTLLHEFAKLRWGVFEEHGYPGDEKFPMFYQRDTWTSEGQTTISKPNFCINEDLNGYQQDMQTGAACALDPNESGLPNENCMFYAIESPKITSSLMAIPYLSTNDYFCDDNDGSNYHNPDIPTKQNLYCNGKSAWSIIKDSDDFKELNPPISNITNPEPQFIIIGGEEQQEMSYVMVMDVSGSMTTSDRLTAMKDAAKRWVAYDVKEGINLGMLPFDSKPRLKEYGFNMTVVDSTSRSDMVEKLDALKDLGGTCITDAIIIAITDSELLNNQLGNSIIILTDGIQNKVGCASTYEVAKEILIANKIRLTTIALGSDADPEIEGLAEATGGMSFFIDDDAGPGEFSDAFDGAVASQTTDTINNTDIVVYQHSWSFNQTINGTFDIDLSLGSNMTFRLEVKNHNQNCSEPMNIVIISPNPEVTFSLSFNCNQNNLGTFIYKFNGDVQNGTWQFLVSTYDEFDSLSILITSRKREESEDPPIQTRCWFNQGEQSVTAENDTEITVMKVSVMAEVIKGNMPVMGSQVQAIITRPNDTMPAIELELLDNGSGADVVKNDGIYSKYFTEYSGAGRYTLKCQVVGNEDTLINEGMDLPTRALPEKPGAPVCCGSNALHPNSKTSKAGAFTRQSVGGSFQAREGEIPKGDMFPPSRVTDLQVTTMCSTPQLKFTSPGDDFDSTAPVTKYTIKYSMYADNMTQNNFDDASIMELTDKDVVGDSTLQPRDGSTQVVIQLNAALFQAHTTYSFGMHATDEAGNKSPLSNIAKGRCAPKSSGVSKNSINIFGLGLLVVIFHLI